MWDLPKKILSSVSDVTVGTAIVLVHMLIAERSRAATGRGVPASGSSRRA